MPDVFSRKKRSEIMSKIRSKSGLDRRLHSILKKNGIAHTMYPKFFGRPDAYLKDSNVVVFADGCFFHKCPKDFRLPKSNRNYWLPKIRKNVARDREINEKLKKLGYRVVRIWEHELKKKSFDISRKIKSH
jgi:DNA mismatch endonuclease (patch repair protein)